MLPQHKPKTISPDIFTPTTTYTEGTPILHAMCSHCGKRLTVRFDERDRSGNELNDARSLVEQRGWSESDGIWRCPRHA